MKRRNIVTAAALVGVLAAVGAVLHGDPHAGQSITVAIVGGSQLDMTPNCAASQTGSSSAPVYNSYANAFRWISGSTACLPLTGYQSPTSGAGYEQFGFFPMRVSSIASVADLAPFDTAVLNVASWEISCNTGNITLAAKQALIDFVGQGKKLIIYDSECPGAERGSPTDTGAPSPIDYNWLPYGFTADSAGPADLPGGPFQIVEQNTLSTSTPGDPHFIDENWIATDTDAAFDANVATTRDPHWCVDMTAQNNSNVTGPVHMYAHYPEGAGTDTTVGLFIWNGLNLDALNGEEQDDPDAGANYGLRKIWLQELEQPFSPSGLPCGVRAAPIELRPPSETNQLPNDTSHTVTATVKDSSGIPQSGIEVTFEIISGPNAGLSSPLNGTCTPSTCTTRQSGEVSWSYTSNGQIGTDTIEACFGTGSSPSCSNSVVKHWVTEQPPPPPPPTSGRMVGGGWLTMNGTQVHHTLHFYCDNSRAQLQVRWNKNRFDLQSSLVTCSDDPSIGPKKGAGAGFDTVSGSGTGTYNGQAATITFRFTDAGEPGSSDYAEYKITSGGSTAILATSTLEGGNHQAHRR